MNAYRVKLTGKRKDEIVLADYFKIDGGVITFRCVNPAGYPIFVKCFAAGAWLSVTNEEMRS
jgi:hypothetical protein